jgi:hypothetical protein
MGACTSYPEQKTYKVCLKCLRDGHRNENIEPLNIEHCYDNRVNLSQGWKYVKFTLMCNKGHVFTYRTNKKDHVKAVIEYIETTH